MVLSLERLLYGISWISSCRFWTIFNWCCDCCCVVCAGITQWGNPKAVSAANYVASINLDSCEQCGTCLELCKFKAIQMKSNGPELDETKCMGCGVCVVNCPSTAIELNRKEREYICKDQIELGLKILKETDRELWITPFLMLRKTILIKISHIREVRSFCQEVFNQFIGMIGKP